MYVCSNLCPYYKTLNGYPPNYVCLTKLLRKSKPLFAGDVGNNNYLNYSKVVADLKVVQLLLSNCN